MGLFSWLFGKKEQKPQNSGLSDEQRQQYEDRIASAQKQAEALTAYVDTLRKQCEEKTAEAQKSAEQLAALVASGNVDASSAELLGKLKKAETELTSATAARKDAEATLAKVQADSKALNDKLAKAETELTSATAARKDAETALSKAQADATALSDKLKQADTELSSATAAREDAEAALVKAQTDAQTLNDKLTKVKKELEDVEEERDDLEDDLKKEKKKRQEVEASNSELETKLSKTTRDLEEAEDAKATLKTSLEKSEQENELSHGSLHFVSELLNAELASKNDQGGIRAVEKAVDDLVEFIEHDLGSYYKAAYYNDNVFDYQSSGNVDPQSLESRDSLVRWAAQAKKTWINGKRAVAFVGEFSAGKTTLVNRLLGQNVNDKNDKGVLFTSAKAATAVPTYVVGGDKERFNFVSKDDELKVLSKQTFTSASKEVMGRIDGLPNLVKYFVMFQKCDALKSLSVLDTPGFSSNDPADAERTIGVINECDALFWVFDVNNGTVNKSSLELIRKNLHRPLYVVINKTNTKSKPEVDNVEALIRDTFQREGLSVEQFIRFGWDTPVDDLLNPIQAIQKNNNDYDVLSYHLDTLVNTIDALKKDVEEKDKERREADENVNGWLDQFKHNFGVLKDQAEWCKDAIKRSWTTHIFHSDKYEFTAEGGKALMDELSELGSNTDVVNKQVEDFKEAVEASQVNDNEYYEQKGRLQTLMDAHDKFSKLINNYRNLQQR